MSYLKRLDELIEKNKDRKEEGKLPLDQILLLRLSELAKLNIAIPVYSEILGCQIWLCSSARMALQVKEDDPDAIIYTVREMRELIKLNPGPENLKTIHNAKAVFPGSKIVDSKLKEEA